MSFPDPLSATDLNPGSPTAVVSTDGDGSTTTSSVGLLPRPSAPPAIPSSTPTTSTTPSPYYQLPGGELMPLSGGSHDSSLSLSRFQSTPNPLSHSRSAPLLPFTPAPLYTPPAPSLDPSLSMYSPPSTSYTPQYPVVPGTPAFDPSQTYTGGYTSYPTHSDHSETPSYYNVSVLETQKFPTLNALFRREIFSASGQTALSTRINKMSVDSREALSQLLNALLAQSGALQDSSTLGVESNKTEPSEAALAVLLSFDDLIDTSLLKGMTVGLRRMKGQQVTVSSLLDRIYQLKERVSPSASSVLAVDGDEDTPDAGQFVEGTHDRPLYADQEVAQMLHTDKGRFMRKLGNPAEMQGLAPLFNDLKQLKTFLSLTKGGAISDLALANLYMQANGIKTKICANGDFPPDQKLALERFVVEQLQFIKNRYLSTGMRASVFATELRKMLGVLSADGAGKKLSSSDATRLEKKIADLEKLGDKVIKLGSEFDGFVNAYVDARMSVFLSPAEKEYQFCVGQIELIKVAEQSYTKNRQAQIALGLKKDSQRGLEALNEHIEKQKTILKDVEFGVQLLNAAGQLLSENSSKMMSLSSLPELQSHMGAIQFALSLHVTEVNNALGTTTTFLVDLVNPLKPISVIPSMFNLVVSKYNLSDEADRVACFKECYSTLVDGFTYEVMGQYKAYMEETNRSYEGLLTQKKQLEEQLKGGKLSPAPSMTTSGYPSSQLPAFAPGYIQSPLSTSSYPSFGGGWYSPTSSPSAPPTPSPVAAFTPVTPPDQYLIEREQQARVAITTVITSLEGFLQTRYSDPNFADLTTRYYQQVANHKGTKNADKVYAKYAEILTTHLNWFADGTEDWAERMFLSPAVDIPGSGDVGRMVYLRLVAMKWAMGQAASL